MIHVGALYLRHCDEVIRKQEAVVCSHTTHLSQALIAVKEELFTESLQLLRLFGQHVAESLLFVLKQLVLAPDQVVLRTLESPT